MPPDKSLDCRRNFLSMSVCIGEVGYLRAAEAPRMRVFARTTYCGKEADEGTDQRLVYM